MTTALATAELKTIRVYGDLAKLLKQRTFKAVVRTPQEAIRFLLANFPEVEAYMLPRFFHIRVGDRAINEDELGAPTGVFEEIRIIPSICGAGGNSGLTQILTGVALIAGSFLLPFASPVLLPLGIGLTLTGIATFLTPTPSDRPESTDPRDSYNFNGLQQTSREGVPVPLVYGEIFTGSVVLSVKVEEDDEELEAVFAAGPGDPNPEQNPFPPGTINPSDFYGWRATIAWSSTLVNLGGGSASGPITMASSDNDVVIYTDFWTSGWSPKVVGEQYWVINSTRVNNGGDPGASQLVYQIGYRNTVQNTRNNVLALYATPNYDAVSSGSISGTITFYATADDYINQTNGVPWSGTDYPNTTAFDDFPI